jgi:transcription initiation factor TFIIF subunit beta
MADPAIKPDPEAGGRTPRFMDDEDIFEDAGDMSINEDPAFQKLWLGRVPKYVWEAWNGLSEDLDAEIQIGTIRHSRESKPDGTFKVRCIIFAAWAVTDRSAGNLCHATEF